MYHKKQLTVLFPMNHVILPSLQAYIIVPGQYARNFLRSQLKKENIKKRVPNATRLKRCGRSLKCLVFLELGGSVHLRAVNWLQYSCGWSCLIFISSIAHSSAFSVTLNVLLCVKFKNHSLMFDCALLTNYTFVTRILLHTARFISIYLFLPHLILTLGESLLYYYFSKCFVTVSLRLLIQQLSTIIFETVSSLSSKPHLRPLLNNSPFTRA